MDLTAIVIIFLGVLWTAFCIHETNEDRKFEAKVRHEEDIRQALRIANS